MREVGDLVLSRCPDPTSQLDDAFHIDRADAVIRMTDESFEEAVKRARWEIDLNGRWPHRLPVVEYEVTDGGESVLRINGTNRSVTYRVVEYDDLTNSWLMEWPD